MTSTLTIPRRNIYASQLIFEHQSHFPKMAQPRLEISQPASLQGRPKDIVVGPAQLHEPQREFIFSEYSCNQVIAPSIMARELWKTHRLCAVSRCYLIWHSPTKSPDFLRV